MANRHLARSISLQTPFEWDFNNKDEDGIVESIKRNVEEFAHGKGDFLFVKELVTNVIAKQKKLDTIIEKAAPEWPIDKISIVDRNILRIGLYELLFADRSEVPAKVAINESIELAKGFGGDSSSRFVNGVLGAVYKEIGEPGKDEVSKKKKFKDIAYEDMPREKLGGAVVYARDKDEVYLALVHDVFGHWTLSKGKLESDEDVKEGTIREIMEEMGLKITIKEKLGENEYVANDPEIGKKRKHVIYFLAESDFTEIKLGPSGGLDDAKWFKMVDILDLNFYDDMLPIVTKAVNILLAKNKA